MARFAYGRVIPAVTTVFPSTENPISESGRWVNNGTLWTKVQTTPGLAFGTQDNTGAFDDSFAHLSGYTSDHYAQGVISKGTTSGLMEVEVWLRAASSASLATGYECNLAHDGSYTEIVRWEGGLGSFTYLSQPGAIGFTPANGDILKGTIKGSAITVQLFRQSTQGWVTINTYDIASDTKKYRSGNPGMGFYRSGGAASNQYGFSSFSAGIY